MCNCIFKVNFNEYWYFNIEIFLNAEISLEVAKQISFEIS